MGHASIITHLHHFCQTKMNLQLHDLLESHPDVNDPLFLVKLSVLPQFNSLCLSKQEAVPTPPNLYFKHQLFCREFLDIYSSLFIFHLAGTGKTRVTKACGENFRLKKGKTKHIKRVIVLAKNKQLANAFKQELAVGEDELMGGRCNNADVLTVDQFYSVEIQSQFASKVAKLSDEEIIDKYSYSGVFIDESQMLTSLDVNNSTPSSSSTPLSVRKKKDIYESIYRFVHLIKYSKVVISTASPMLNFSVELAYQMNLLPPKSRAMPLDLDYNNITIEEVEPYFRGRVSYVRNQENEVIAKYMNRGVDSKSIDTNLSLWCIPMKNEVILRDGQILEGQSASYLRLYKSNKRNDQLRTAECQASNFVFPDGSYGSKGFDSGWIRKEEGGSSNQLFSASNSLNKLMKDALPSMSCKMNEARKLTTEIDGCSIVYVGYKNGSGAFLMGLTYEVLEAPNRFVRYLGNSSLSSNSSAITKLLPSDGVTVPYRYVILTSEIEGWNTILSICCGKENIDGRLIKVVLLTKIAREGISIAHARRIIVLSSEWNLSSLYQAIARGLRVTSQDCLIKREKERLLEEGKDPSTARITVEIYQLASYTIDEGNIVSVDIDHYLTAEKKNKPIFHLTECLIRTAVDYLLNSERNSHTCDASLFKPYYISVDDEHSLQSSSYPLQLNLLPIVTKEIKSFLQRSKEPYTCYEDLVCALDRYDERLVALAIESLCSEPSLTLDRFGFDCYISFSDNRIFLQRMYPLISEVDEYSLYSNVVVGVENQDLEDYINTTRTKKSISSLALEFNGTREEALSTIQGLTFEEGIEMLEFSILQSSISTQENLLVIKPTSLIAEVAIQEYENMIYESYQLPLRQISPNSKKARSPSVKRLGPDDFTEKKIFHSMYHYHVGRAAYRANSNVHRSYGRIRIFEPPTSRECGRWRDTSSDEEHEVYRSIIQDVLQEKASSFEKHDVYGKMLYGSNTLKIRNKLLEREEASSNARLTRLGIACNSMSKRALVELMFSLSIHKSSDSNKSIESKRHELSVLEPKLDTQNLGDDRVSYYYSLLASDNATKDHFCNTLKEWFIENNRLLIV